ncbi:response regulator [Pseudonocardia sp.]|uniref:response regulator n=1 Tax=Pseudonocardia sp. TaxID=60912 RepID=UPI0026111E60|nr:response regulator transcription factor [Pseudonocardia sp.]MCW2717982.1 DNA-binding response regulator [Pseudonocardia sp.]
MTSAGPPVLVVDDHHLVAASLAMALRGRGIAAVAVAPAEFVDRLDRPAPPGGMVMLDLELGAGLDGTVLVPRLRAAGWEVVIVTGTLDESRVAAAVTAGAAGWVLKSAPFDELVATAVRVVEGRPLLSDVERARLRTIAETVGAADRHRQQCWVKLTPRERQIVDRIVQGKRPTAIAEEFVVSVATVRTQIRSILTKMEVGSQLEVAALVRELRRGDGRR